MQEIRHYPWPTVYVMVGVPASGKSTWAAEQSEGRNAVIVSRDGIRAMLTGSNKKLVGDNDFESLVTRIEDESVAAAIQSGKNVILDATNTRVASTVKRMADVAQSVLYPHLPFPNIIPVRMDTPLEECLRRNDHRQDSVPPNVIINMHKRLEKSPS